MARIRTIKPDFFTSDTVTSLPIRARVTWIGLWTHCDDYGRCRDNVKLIKAAVWPLDDVSLRDIVEDLQALIDAGVVFKYEAAGKSYLQITGWDEHQRVDRPSKSAIPPPCTGNGSYPQASARETLASPRDELDREGKGTGKGKGGDARASPRSDSPDTPPQPEPPPRKCPKHLHTTDPPDCGACKEARLALEAWHRQQAQHRNQQQRASQQHPRHAVCGQRHPADACPASKGTTDDQPA